MQDELEDSQDDYHYPAHEYWCYLLSTIKVKENSERDDIQIKRLVTSKSAYHYDRNEYIRVLHDKRVSTGVITNRKYQGKNAPKHNGIQCYCALCKKARMTHQKYMAHSSENRFFERSYQQSIKDGLGGSLGNRADAVKQYKNLNINGRKN